MNLLLELLVSLRPDIPLDRRVLAQADLREGRNSMGVEGQIQAKLGILT